MEHKSHPRPVGAYSARREAAVAWAGWSARRDMLTMMDFSFRPERSRYVQLSTSHRRTAAKPNARTHSRAKPFTGRHRCIGPRGSRSIRMPRRRKCWMMTMNIEKSAREYIMATICKTCGTAVRKSPSLFHPVNQLSFLRVYRSIPMGLAQRLRKCITQTSQCGEPPDAIQRLPPLLCSYLLSTVNQTKVWVFLMTETDDLCQPTSIGEYSDEAYPMTSSSAPAYSTYSSALTSSSSGSWATELYSGAAWLRCIASLLAITSSGQRIAVLSTEMNTRTPSLIGLMSLIVGFPFSEASGRRSLLRRPRNTIL